MGDAFAGGYLEFEKPIFELEAKIAELTSIGAGVDLSAEIDQLRNRCLEMKKDIYGSLLPWHRVQIARHSDRPSFTDYRDTLFTDWVELHGDRTFGDDRAIMCGFARLEGRPVLLVGHEKGKTTRERIDCNFGSAHPEGYRKALRKMKLAAKLGLPVITFINTPGAYPGIGAEERGQAFAIAENLLELARLKTPIICVCIGEGGSGGALGIGIGDRLLMMEYAYYSVISPEGCAAILWKSGEKVIEASNILKLTAADLHGFGIMHEIVPEPLGGAHKEPGRMMGIMREVLIRQLDELSGMDPTELLDARYAHIRRIGAWVEERTIIPEEALEDADSPLGAELDLPTKLPTKS